MAAAARNWKLQDGQTLLGRDPDCLLINFISLARLLSSCSKETNLNLASIQRRCYMSDGTGTGDDDDDDDDYIILNLPKCICSPGRQTDRK